MKQKGFTIVELLVVIAVIAILISVALPRFKGMQDEGNISKAQAEVRLLQSAVESYYTKQSPNAYPATTVSLCASYLNSASPNIVNTVLIDPFNSSGEEYRFIKSSNGRYYVIFSYGIDGAADITGINDSGVLQGADDDDIYASNGVGFSV